MDKLLTTKYILLKLGDWFYELNPNRKDNDLSVLKTLKLIFLLSTIEKEKIDENLLDLKFTFKAMPYGPVETDIYKAYKSGDLSIISNKGLDYKSLKEMDFNDIKTETIEIINKNVDLLKKENYYLISNSASYLVDLTHLYSSWKNNFKKAQAQGKFSIEIPTQEIKEEKTYYSL